MTLTVQMPSLEKSVTQIRDVPNLQWIKISAAGIANWLFPALRQLDEFQAAPRGWDGHDSPPVAAQAAEKARRLLASVPSANLPEPALFPFPGGGVGIQWQIGQRELQLTVYPDGEMTYLAAAGAGNEEIRDGSLSSGYENEVGRLTRWLVDG